MIRPLRRRPALASAKAVEEFVLDAANPIAISTRSAASMALLAPD
jgi:hypothetical protein